MTRSNPARKLFQRARRDNAIFYDETTCLSDTLGLWVEHLD